MEKILELAKKIRLMIFDVDGILTNGKLLYGSQNTEYKAFHVHDGQGMVLLQKSGIPIGIITAKNSDIVAKRMSDLKVKYVYQGYSDKLLAYEDLKQKLNVTDEEIAYMGDDLHDVPLLKRVGLSITAANAQPVIMPYVTWVTKANGGKGAVREVCDYIMQAQGTYAKAIEYFLER